MAERGRKAKRIIENPHDFKICEGCDSIVAQRVATCPNCFGYRFNEDPDTVVEHAGTLAAREQRTVLAEDLL